jgi:hypothetical protein
MHTLNEERRAERDHLCHAKEEHGWTRHEL